MELTKDVIENVAYDRAREEHKRLAFIHIWLFRAIIYPIIILYHLFMLRFVENPPFEWVKAIELTEWQAWLIMWTLALIGAIYLLVGRRFRKYEKAIAGNLSSEE